MSFPRDKDRESVQRSVVSIVMPAAIAEGATIQTTIVTIIVEQTLLPKEITAVRVAPRKE